MSTLRENDYLNNARQMCQDMQYKFSPTSGTTLDSWQFIDAVDPAGRYFPVSYRDLVLMYRGYRIAQRQASCLQQTA